MKIYNALIKSGLLYALVFASGQLPAADTPPEGKPFAWAGAAQSWNLADPWLKAENLRWWQHRPVRRTEWRIDGLTLEDNEVADDNDLRRISREIWSGSDSVIARDSFVGPEADSALPAWLTTLPFPTQISYGFAPIPMSAPTGLAGLATWEESTATVGPFAAVLTTAGNSLPRAGTLATPTLGSGAVVTSGDLTGNFGTVAGTPGLTSTLGKNFSPEVPVAPSAVTWPLSWAIDTGIYTMVPIGPKVYGSGTTNLVGGGVGKVAAFTAGGLSMSGSATRLNMSGYDVYFFTANPEDGSSVTLGSTYTAKNQVTVSGGAQGSFTSLGVHTGWLQFTPSLDWTTNLIPRPPSTYVLQVSGAGSALTFSNSLQIDMWYYGWLVTNGGSLSITGVPDSLRNPSVPSINGMMGGGTMLSGYVNAPGYNNAGIVADGINSHITLNETGTLLLGTGVFAANGGAIIFDGTGGQGGGYLADLQETITLSGAASSITFQNYSAVTVESGALASLSVPAGTLSIIGTGDGSTFSTVGSPAYAATASGANLTIANFQNFSADATTPISASGGGKVTLSGSNTLNSQLAVNGTTVTVNGTGAAATSNLTFSNFGTENIQTNLTAGTYGQIYLTGGFGSATLGSAGTPVTLQATGIGADLRVNNNGTTTGTLGSLSFYGSAAAASGGKLYLDGTTDGSTPVTFTGNLSATGASSSLYFRYFGNPVFGSSQSLAATTGGLLSLLGPGTPGSLLTINGSTVTVNGTGVGAATSTLNLQNYGGESIQTNLTAGTYGRIYLTGVAGAVSLGASSAPVTLQATGTNADLRVNNDGTTTGTLGSLTFYGSAAAASGGTLYLDGTANGSTPVTFTGNLSATGLSSAIYYRYFALQNFAHTQTLTATGSVGGGTSSLNLSGTKLADANNALTFDPKLVLADPVTGYTGIINLKDYQTVLAGDDGQAVLNFSAGTLTIDGSGLAGSLFTAAGNTSTAALGATGSTAKLNIGVTTGFETFTASGSAALTATGGGTVKVWGTNTAASTLNLTGAVPNVTGTSSAVSSMTFQNFATENITGSATATTYGHLYFLGGSTALNLGTLASPVNLVATGAGAQLYFNYNGASTGTLGALNYYGNGSALGGGTLVIDGSANGTTPSNFAGNLTASGYDSSNTGSNVYYRYFPNQVLASTQTLTAANRGALNFNGAVNNPAANSLTFNPTLDFSGGNGGMFFYYYKTVTAGDSASAFLKMTGPGTLTFSGLMAGTGAGSSFTVAGASTLGATVSGAVLNIGVWGYETFTVLGNHPATVSLEASGGGDITVVGTNSALSALTLASGSNIKALGVASDSSNLRFSGFSTVNIQTDLTAGAYSNFNLDSSSLATNMTLGTSTAPITLTSNGRYAYFALNFANAPSGTLNLYGNAVSNFDLSIYGTTTGTTTSNFSGNDAGTTGNLTAAGGILRYNYFADQVFDPKQTLAAKTVAGAPGNLTLTGAYGNLAHDTLSLDASLVLETGSTIRFDQYKTVNVGTNASAHLLVNAGTLIFTGTGDGSSFTAAGGATLGATASGAVLSIGQGGSSGYTPSYGFQNFTATGSNPLQATGGGIVYVYGSNTTASTLAINPLSASNLNAPITVGGTNSSNLSYLVFSSFYNENIRANLTANDHGYLILTGSTGGGFVFGSSNPAAPTPVTLTATGASAHLYLNDSGANGTTPGNAGSMSLYGNLVASLGGLLYFDGVGAGTTSLTFPDNPVTPSQNGNLTATGTGSTINFLNFPDQNFTFNQTFTATGGSTLNFTGAAGNLSHDTLALDANLVLNAASTISFTRYKTVVVGAHASNSLLVSAGTLIFGGTGDGSSFTAAGGVPFGATAPGATLYLGTSPSPFEDLTVTGSNPLQSTGGGTVYAYGSNTSNATLTINPISGSNLNAPITVGGTGATTGSILYFYNYYTSNIQANLTAGDHGSLSLTSSPGGSATVGSVGTPVALTATGTGAVLGMTIDQNIGLWGSLNASNAGIVTTWENHGTLNLNGNLNATGGGTVNLKSGYTDTVFNLNGNVNASSGGTVNLTGPPNAPGVVINFSGNLLADGGTINYGSFPTPAFSSGQALTAINGGTIALFALPPGSGAANLALSTITLNPGVAVTVNGTSSSGLSTLSFISFNNLVIQQDLLAGAYGKISGTGYGIGTITVGTAAAPVTLTAAGTSAQITLGTTGGLALNGSLSATGGGSVSIRDYNGVQPGYNRSLTWAGNLFASGTGSTVTLSYYANPVLPAPYTIQARAGGTVTMDSAYPLALDATLGDLTLSASATPLVSADGASSAVNFTGFKNIHAASAVSATNSGAVSFSTLYATSFALTTAGDSTGNVNVRGRAAAGFYPTLALANIQATGSNLNFSLFGPYTLGASVAAYGGGLNFTGYTTTLTSGTPAVSVQVQQSPLTGSFSSLNGGWGTAYATPFNNVTLSIDSTSAYSLKNLDLTGGSLAINGTLNILPSADNYAPNQVRFNQNAFPLSGSGTINVNSGATLTTVTTTGASPMYWSLPATMTLTGQGTVRQLAPLSAVSNITPNAGTILSDTTGTLTVVATSLPATTILQNTGTVRFQGNAAGTSGGLINFSGYSTIDNPGTIETISTYLPNAASLLPSSLAILSTTTMGNVQANGVNVKLDLTGASATLSNQSVNALNGSTVILDGRDVLNSTLTGTGGGLLLGAASNATFTNLTTLTASTLSGTGTVLRLGTPGASPAAGYLALNNTATVYNADNFRITGGAQLQLVGSAGTLLYSTNASNGAAAAGLARIAVDTGGSILGAGNTAGHQIALDLLSGGSITVYNASLATSAPNLANAPVLPVPFQVQAMSLPGAAGSAGASAASVAGAKSYQTLTVLGDLQMAAGSTLNVTIFGNSTNANSLLLVGSAGTPASTLGGNLAVTVASGVSLTADTLFVVLQENGTGYGTSRFANAPAGTGTLTSADGNWLFGVSYANSQVILSNATAVPEPSTYAALAGLAALGLVCSRRRFARRS